MSAILDVQDKISETLHLIECVIMATTDMHPEHMNPVATTLGCARERLRSAEVLLDTLKKREKADA